VILGQITDAIQRDEPGSRQDATLTDAAAQHLSYASSLVDPCRIRDQHRTDGCAEALAQAHLHRVGTGSERRDRNIEGDSSIPQPRAVQVHLQSAITPGGNEIRPLVRSDHSTAGEVVGVLERKQRRP